MNSKEERQYEKMVLLPVESLVVRLAIPTIISQMVTMIYNLVDSYFVGKLGTSASAAVGIVVSLHALFQSVGLMFGHGVGTNLSILQGQGKEEEADQFLAVGLTISLVLSLIIMALGLVFLDPLMRLLGSTETILPYARTYGFYILISGPAFVASCMLNSIMRYEGRAVLAMVGLVSGGVLNMIGDPILMFRLGMGINGAGLSTAVSQYISLGILLYMFLSGKTISHLALINFFKYPARIMRIVKNGLPSMIRQVMNSVSTAVLNNCARPYGDAAISAMTITGRVMMFLAAIALGLGQGFQPAAAYNYGAGKYSRLRRAFRFTFIFAECLLGFFSIIGLIFPGRIVEIFRNDPAVIAIGIPAIRFMCLATIVQPINLLANMMFQGIGRSREAALMASMRSGIFYIPLLIILPKFIEITGIQCAQLIADLITLCVAIPILIRFFRTIPKEDYRSEIDEKYSLAIVSERE
ncbi:MAG: MATE family efflux transporter [Lachnospiraceae bacterium]|nr:MATE family efflux transporter [Lachnospiraceae bacterium]